MSDEAPKETLGERQLKTPEGRIRLLARIASKSITKCTKKNRDGRTDNISEDQKIKHGTLALQAIKQASAECKHVKDLEMLETLKQELADIKAMTKESSGGIQRRSSAATIPSRSSKATH